jgi:hypothetical protein
MSSETPGARWRRAKVIEWTAAGLCPGCGRDRDDPRRRRCAACRAATNARNDKVYAARKAAGLCVNCGRVPARSGFVTCGRTCFQKPKPEKARDYRLAARDRHRLAVLAAYGGRCSCCGEVEPLFLEIDHEAQDGAAHRRQVRSSSFYGWLIRSGFPEGFRILCRNCNFGVFRNGGVCPHQVTL